MMDSIQIARGRKNANRFRNMQGPAGWPETHNPSVRCITCGKARRERAMGVWDVPNDVFMCDEACEEHRPDRITTDD